MRSLGCNFGGEQSGHLVFLDHATTGDGLVAALQVLAIMLREDRPLSELTSTVMTRVPQVLVNTTLPERRPLDELAATQRAIADAEKRLGRDGRVLVRWSGTEPKLRVMVEGPSEDLIVAIANDITGLAPGVITTLEGSTEKRFLAVASAAIASRSCGSPSGGP